MSGMRSRKLEAGSPKTEVRIREIPQVVPVLQDQLNSGKIHQTILHNGLHLKGYRQRESCFYDRFSCRVPVRGYTQYPEHRKFFFREMCIWPAVSFSLLTRYTVQYCYPSKSCWHNSENILPNNVCTGSQNQFFPTCS